VHNINLTPIQKVLTVLFAATVGFLLGYLFFVLHIERSAIGIALMVALSLGLLLVLKRKKFTTTTLNFEVQLSRASKFFVVMLCMALGMFLGMTYLKYQFGDHLSVLLIADPPSVETVEQNVEYPENMPWRQFLP
jgi:hypothetical protein